MKKVLFGLMLVLFLVGCNSDKEPEEEANEQTELKIAFVEIKDLFGKIIVSGEIENAPETLEVEVEVAGVDNDYKETNIQQLNKFGAFFTDKFTVAGNPLEVGEYNIQVYVEGYDIKQEEVYVIDYVPDKPIETAVDDEGEVEENIEVVDKQQMFSKVVDLIDEGLAFDTGSYIKGDIPKGEYAFISFDGSGHYYSEEDASGSIIDNENFDSFGYVIVHEAGNIRTDGALINIDSLETLEVSGAKELYEIMNEIEDYSDSGWYKVGMDIDPGEYVIESYGSGYVAVMAGPVGKSDIIENENFDGRYSVNLQEGQYLNISKATIAE